MSRKVRVGKKPPQENTQTAVTAGQTSAERGGEASRGRTGAPPGEREERPQADSSKVGAHVKTFSSVISVLTRNGAGRLLGRRRQVVRMREFEKELWALGVSGSPNCVALCGLQVGSGGLAAVRRVGVGKVLSRKRWKQWPAAVTWKGQAIRGNGKR